MKKKIKRPWLYYLVIGIIIGIIGDFTRKYNLEFYQGCLIAAVVGVIYDTIFINLKILIDKNKDRK